MKLIVGLGNPGEKYRNTRHNAGFLVLDRWAARHGMKFRRMFDVEFLEYRGCLLAKPQTFMNLSGKAVKGLYKSRDIEELLVVVDDIWLPAGEVRLRVRGGDGGHNGLKSVIAELGSQEFLRLRLGVGDPGGKSMPDHVLSNFAKAEREGIDGMIEFCTDLLDTYIVQDAAAMLNVYSQNKTSYSGETPGIDNPGNRAKQTTGGTE